MRIDDGDEKTTIADSSILLLTGRDTQSCKTNKTNKYSKFIPLASHINTEVHIYFIHIYTLTHDYK